MEIPLQMLPWTPGADAAFFDALPDARAVYLLSTGEGAEPFAGKTAHLRARLRRLLQQPEAGSKALNLRSVVQQVAWLPAGSDFEADWHLYRIAREVYPRAYRRWLRLRLPAMVRLNLANPYPRAHVCRGIGRPPSLFFGPFPSRARAELFTSHFLDLFKLRRCVDDLHPDPAFPGCIYSEMKMCLAPCFRGCTDEEYAAETAEVREFLSTRGDSLRTGLENERDRASQELEFERAAVAHGRLEKLQAVLRELPLLARDVATLRGVIVQRALPGEQPTVNLFPVDRGVLHGPFALQLTTPKIGESLEAFVAAQVETIFNELKPLDRRSRNDHLALIARWFYRSRRQGELLLWPRTSPIPRRQITRAAGRVLSGEIASEG